jgi:uncharacterized membrane protein
MPGTLTNDAGRKNWNGNLAPAYQQDISARRLFMHNPRSTASIAGHPIHPMLVPIPIACFLGTLVTDLAYWRSLDLQWAVMSSWLLTAGLVVAFFAVIAGLVEFFGDRRIRDLRAVWIHAIGNAIALVLAIVNAFIHSRDGYNSVVPYGLLLSALVVLILVVTGWFGWSMVYRHRVGVLDQEERT